MTKRESQQVDVICSVYNPNSTSLRKSVQSVLAQTYLSFKLVLVDDGSTDINAIRMLDEIAVLDQRITLVRKSVNVGLSQNLYEQVEKSSASYIARIDAGDVWLESKLEIQIKVLECNPELLVVGTQCLYVDEVGNEIGRSWFAESHEDILRAIRKRRGVFEHSSIVFVNKINYRTEFKMSQDLDLYLRAISVGRLYCLDGVFTRCEINRSGLTIQKRYLQRKYQELAYQSCYAVVTSGKDVPLYVKSNSFECRMWSWAQPFYISYVTARSEKRSIFVWLPYLLATILLYPSLAKDYLRKVLPERLQPIVQVTNCK
jgi:glycosyltransferase involved in cell wall biosynthesis